MTEGAAGLVDWGLAERTAATVAGEDGRVPATAGVDRPGLERACADALRLASAYTGLEASEPPVPEPLGREEWARNALATLRDAAAMIEGRTTDRIPAPRPIGAIARRIAGAATGIEAGVAAGYAARRVLGQYDVAIVGAERPARLLLVTPNLEAARRHLDAEPALLLRWIALHESAHVLQFEGVPWLRGHVRGLVARLLDAAGDLDIGGLVRRLMRSDPRQVIRAALGGELARVLAGDAERRVLDRLQATMAALEGHAEHVADACAAAGDPAAAELGRRVEARRERRSGLSDLIGRLLGFEIKLRQYRLGKAFCDQVTDRAGAGALVGLWDSPDSLPSAAELESPDDWLSRVGPSSVAVP